eukprot:TRINITY_DN12342_c0_g2_i1.p1 TRINITY_DN12342_c0_g2~~TRINITY_DN12342_c0_g2_i1.p1  ORF type:complete len:701 (+),score=167.93 TRINITY_DN12342_c0_g2_i1:50-2152(+)
MITLVYCLAGIVVWAPGASQLEGAARAANAAGYPYEAVNGGFMEALCNMSDVHGVVGPSSTVVSEALHHVGVPFYSVDDTARFAYKVDSMLSLLKQASWLRISVVSHSQQDPLLDILLARIIMDTNITLGAHALYTPPDVEGIFSPFIPLLGDVVLLYGTDEQQPYLLQVLQAASKQQKFAGKVWILVGARDTAFWGTLPDATRRSLSGLLSVAEGVTESVLWETITADLIDSVRAVPAGGGWDGGCKLTPWSSSVPIRPTPTARHASGFFNLAGADMVAVGTLNGTATVSNITWGGEVYVPPSWPLGKAHLNGKHFRVLTKMVPPMMMANSAGGYHGISYDLLAELSKAHNFTFELTVTSETAQDKILRAMIDGGYTMSLSSITITPERKEFVDFTQPYMHVGGLLLVKTPDNGISLWGFLNPFSYGVWLLWAAALLVVAVVFSVTESATLSDGLWYGTTVMLAGSDTAPKTAAGRVLGLAAMLLSVILIAAYTASLAVFLGRRDALPVHSYIDITSSKLPSHLIGALAGSTMQDWYERALPGETTAKYYSYDMMFDAVAQGDVHVGIVDSPIGQFRAATDCGLTVAGDPFELSGYGIAVNKGSPFTSPLSKGILELIKSGYVTELTEQYFSTRCAPFEEESVVQMTAQEMSGVFIASFVFIAAGVILHFTRSFLSRPRKVPFTTASPLLEDFSQFSCV